MFNLFSKKKVEELEAENRRLKRQIQDMSEHKNGKTPIKSTKLDEWVIHLDSQNNIAYINSTLAKDLKLDRDALKNKGLSEIDYIFGKGKLKEMVEEAKISGKIIESKMNYNDKIYLIKALVYNETPQLIVDDITKLSGLESKLSSLEKLVDPSVIEELLEKGIDVSKIEKKTITILYGDIRKFTKYVEKANPDEFRSVINDYLDAMTDIIKSGYKGTVDKFIGDKVMAFFGAPKEMEKHADTAVKAAVEMQKTQKGLVEKWKVPLYTGIGINTGEVMVGLFGSDKRSEYTCYGNDVNLADRICGIAEPNEILISQNTYERLADKLDFKDIGEKTFKGIEKPVKIYSKKI
jgi:class 3 adenylate cyclase